eukprot:238032-Prymnesium_polylepis.1
MQDVHSPSSADDPTAEDASEASGDGHSGAATAGTTAVPVPITCTPHVGDDSHGSGGTACPIASVDPWPHPVPPGALSLLVAPAAHNVVGGGATTAAAAAAAAGGVAHDGAPQSLLSSHSA